MLLSGGSTRIHLQPHSGCWQNSFPFGVGPRAPIFCWMLARSHCLVLEATDISLTCDSPHSQFTTCCFFKARRAVSPLESYVYHSGSTEVTSITFAIFYWTEAIGLARLIFCWVSPTLCGRGLYSRVNASRQRLLGCHRRLCHISRPLTSS